MNPHSFSPVPQRLVCYDNPVAPDDLRAQIAKEIDCLKAEIETLQRCHNSSTQICRLPPELLSRVFSILSLDWKWWIRVTHVCHHWRVVALGCASLWSNINFSHPKFTKAKLQRSRDAPLSVEYHPEQGKFASHGHLGLVLANPNRLRHVSLKGAYPIYQALLSSWTRPSATLKSFSLVMQHPTMGYLPATFLQGPEGVPSLESLTLVFAGSKWRDLPLGRSITTLHLHERHYGQTHAHRPSLKEFLRSMDNMPLLQDIHLHGVLPLEVHSLSSSESHSFSHLYFPNLRRIKVQDLAEPIAQFFNILQLPGFMASIDIAFMGQPSLHFCGSYSRVGRNVIGLALRHLKSALGTNRDEVILVHKMHASATTYQFYTSFSETSGGGSRTIRVSSTLGTFTYDACALLTMFTATFNFSALQDLEVDTSHPVLRASDAWQYLGSLPSIVAIRLTGVLPSAFLEALKARAPCHSSTPKAAYFFGLARLTLDGTTLPTHETDPDDVSVWEVTHRFIGICRKRAKFSLPLSELHLRGLEGLGEDEAERIRNAVPGIRVFCHSMDRCTNI